MIFYWIDVWARGDFFLNGEELLHNVIDLQKGSVVTCFLSTIYTGMCLFGGNLFKYAKICFLSLSLSLSW